MRAEDEVPIANRLLAALPQGDYLRMRPSLQQVTLTLGEVLHEPGAAIRHVYFPNDSLVSMLMLVDRHMALEVGLVGREGMVGMACGSAAGIDTSRIVVQATGTAMRMTSARFRKALLSSRALRAQVHTYTHALMAQVAQTAACNRFHVVEERLARRLLMTRDRLCSDRFRFTHESLGHMLGVRRVGVTKAAHALKQRKLIDYSRGNIAIVDGRRLEAAACSCYEAVRDKCGDG